MTTEHPTELAVAASPTPPGPADGAEAASEPRPRRRVPFGVALVPIVLVGLAVRIAYLVGWRLDEGLLYDGPTYAARARFLRGGLGFLDPEAWFFHGRSSPGAIHPPGNTVLLAIGQQFGLRTEGQLQLLGCLVGTATIVAIALLGREVAGRRVGLVAAAIAAIHPGLWSFDPSAMAETPGQLITAVVLLLAYRLWRSPTVVSAAWLGGAAAVAALVRSELSLLIVILVLPLCLVAPGSTGLAARRIGAALLWFVVALAPWVGWNLVRFEHPVAIASGIDVSLAYAQCDETWYGPNTGYWNLFCASDIARANEDRPLDESELGRLYRRQAGAYIGDHLGRWPVVLAARAARTLSVYPPATQIAAEDERESREAAVLWAATFAAWAGYALAAVAFVRPPRSRAHLVPLLAPLLAGVAGAVITFGTSRYRSAGEVGLIVLAAVGVDALARAWNAHPSAEPAVPLPAPSSAPGGTTAPPDHATQEPSGGR